MKIKLYRALSASLLFLVLLLSTYYLHIKFFTVDVILYSAIGDGIFASVTAAIILFLNRYFIELSSFEKSQLIISWLMTAYIFAISGPTVIDRSLSFYLLEKLDQRGGAIRQDAFEYIFTNEYMKEHRLVDVRLTEQLKSGTITIEDGCVELTRRGKAISAFSRFFRQNLLPSKRLLMGEYSSDLTNPFRDSEESSNYGC